MADQDEVDPAAICARGTISNADVAAIRRGYYKDGTVSEAEADALFAIEQNCKSPAAWGALFVEAVTDYLVNQVKPEGYVTSENAQWLTERITVDGKVQTQNELELLIHVLEEARWTPTSLSALALAQVRHAIIDSTGPLRVGPRPATGIVTASDVNTLRRILYASGGDGSTAVTRAEAEVLMDIAEAADDALSDPAWIDLYTKAIANHLMAGAGFAPPSREEALKREEWLEAEPNLGGFFGEMVQSGLQGVWSAYHVADAETAELARLEDYKRSILVSEEVTAPEAAWLADRIGRDGHVGEAEKALLAFIGSNCPKIDPALKQLIAKVA